MRQKSKTFVFAAAHSFAFAKRIVFQSFARKPLQASFLFCYTVKAAVAPMLRIVVLLRKTPFTVQYCARKPLQASFLACIIAYSAANFQSFSKKSAYLEADLLRNLSVFTCFAVCVGGS